MIDFRQITADPCWMAEASIVRGDVGFSDQGISYAYIGIQFNNVQTLLGHDSPGCPYFNTGNRFDLITNSVDIAVFPVASSPTTG